MNQSPASQDPTARKVGWKKAAGFLLILWLAVFLLLELAWRGFLFASWEGFFDNPKEFTSTFFTTFEEPLPFKGEITAWYRNSEVQIAKKKGEIRIICFGGSTTVNQAAGISYAELLEQRFADRYPGYTIRVLNAGSDAFSTAHTLVNLSLRNLELEPDIVTVYQNVNDLSAKDFGDSITSDYTNKYRTDFYLGFRHRTGVIAELTKVSRLARAVVSRIDWIAFPQGRYGAGRDEVGRDYRKGLAYFRKNLTSLSGVAGKHGVKMVFATQAAGSDYRNDEAFSAYNDVVRQVALEEGVVLIDIVTLVTQDANFQADALHYTREGVEHLADAFFGPLDTLVKEEIRSRGMMRETDKSGAG